MNCHIKKTLLVVYCKNSKSNCRSKQKRHFQVCHCIVKPITNYSASLSQTTTNLQKISQTQPVNYLVVNIPPKPSPIPQKNTNFAPQTINETFGYINETSGYINETFGYINESFSYSLKNR